MAVDQKYGAVQVEKGTIPADEPVFILRGQDNKAVPTIRHYAQLRRDAGDIDGAKAVEDVADLMDRWPTKKDPS